MQLSTLVILYNSSLTDSTTLQSLLNCQIPQNLIIKLTIWNNGPYLLEDKEISKFFVQFKKLGFNVEIYQDVRNLALSKIYNYQVNNGSFDFFIPFDQDSYLSADFFQIVAKHANYFLILPKIKSNNRIKFPYYVKQGPILKEGKVELNRVTSINSGIAISKQLVDIFKNEKLNLFDEHFALYGIDTVFFLNLWMLYKKYSHMTGGCFGEIKHSLAMDEEQEKLGKLSPNRRLEYLYFFILYRLHYKKRSKLSVLFLVIKKICQAKIKNKKSIFNILQCVFTGQHPRSVFSLFDNKN